MRTVIVRKKSQQGVGLVEVIVALVVLSIGVLGIVAMQLKAVDASNEAGTRVQAVALAQDLSERIRINSNQLATYVSKLNAQNQDATAATANSCYAAVAADKLAECDVAQVLARAAQYNMQVAMPTCPGMASGRRCIYVSWSTTKPINGDDAAACTKNGLYKANSRCIVFESY